MDDTTYQGWTNYETWAVALWLGNDEYSYKLWRNVTQQHLTDKLGRDYEETNDPDAKSDATLSLSRELENWLENNNPLADQNASLFTDLMTTAINEANCYEIAKHWIDAELE